MNGKKQRAAQIMMDNIRTASVGMDGATPAVTPQSKLARKPPVTGGGMSQLMRRRATTKLKR